MSSSASRAADWLSYSPEYTTQKPPASESKSSESRMPTSGIPSSAKLSALSRAASSDDLEASTTVQPSLPAGHSAMPPEPPGVLVALGVAEGVAVAVGVGVGVAVGVA